MRDFDKHYGHADLVNRRARLLIIFVLLLLGGLVVGVNAFGSESGDAGASGAGGITPPASVLAASVLSTTTSQPLRPVATSSTSTNGTVATTTTPVPTTTTSVVSDSTTTTRPATTTPRPSTTTTPPTTTTTSTTTPPTTTTTSTTTTTAPPTTTTTVPVGAWFPILTADAFCDDDNQMIRWSASDPDESWSSGWQMVIDGDNRGLFPSGTIVTNDSGPAVSLEEVDTGKHTLTLDVHWERIGTGSQDRGFGTFSITVNADTNCHD